MGMTNGEKIQQDFACEVCEPIIEDNIIHVIFADKKDSAIGFDLDWWSAEYKEPTPQVFEEVTSQEKPLIHMLLPTLFCEECGITETSPSFGQQYCRYCGTKFKNKPWIYEEGDKK